MGPVARSELTRRQYPCGASDRRRGKPGL